MENRIDKLEEALKSTNIPLYIDSSFFPENLFDEFSYKIDGNCSNEELDNKIKELNNMEYNKYIILKINLNNSSEEKQKRFKSIIKDKTYKEYNINSDCKILVVCNDLNKIEDEIKSLLFVI